MTKAIFVLLTIVLAHYTAFAQASAEYKGGIRALSKLVGQVERNNSGSGVIRYVKESHYFLVLFTLDPSGGMKDGFTVVSDPPDTMPVIAQIMKKTIGNWINYSGHDIEVVLPLYFLFADGDSNLDPVNCPMMITKNSADGKRMLVQLEPLITKIYDKPVH